MSKKLKNVFNIERLESIENIYKLPQGTLTKNKIKTSKYIKKKDYIENLCTTLCSLTLAKYTIEDKTLLPYDYAEYQIIDPESLLNVNVKDIDQALSIDSAIEDVLSELANTCGHAV